MDNLHICKNAHLVRSRMVARRSGVTAGKAATQGLGFTTPKNRQERRLAAKVERMARRSCGPDTKE